MIIIPFSTPGQSIASPLDELRRWGVDQLDEITRRELMTGTAQSMPPARYTPPLQQSVSAGFYASQTIGFAIGHVANLVP